ncbi:MAG: hypothetical protein U0R72_20445 [Nakamurella multipartita]
MIKPSSFSRREVKVSVLAGALAALLVVLAGAAIAFTSTTKWTAESVLVVLPNADLSASDSAAYYETLSRGQIVATFAEVADNQRFQDQAEASLQLTDAQRAGVTTAVTVVPDTSVILVRTTAGTAQVAEQLADETTTLATAYLAGLSEPYRTTWCTARPARRWPRYLAGGPAGPGRHRRADRRRGHPAGGLPPDADGPDVAGQERPGPGRRTGGGSTSAGPDAQAHRQEASRPGTRAGRPDRGDERRGAGEARPTRSTRPSRSGSRKAWCTPMAVDSSPLAPIAVPITPPATLDLSWTPRPPSPGSRSCWSSSCLAAACSSSPSCSARRWPGRATRCCCSPVLTPNCGRTPRAGGRRALPDLAPQRRSRGVGAATQGPPAGPGRPAGRVVAAGHRVRRVHPDLAQFGELALSAGQRDAAAAGPAPVETGLVDVAHNPLPYDVNGRATAVEKTGRLTRSLLAAAYRACDLILVLGEGPRTSLLTAFPRLGRVAVCGHGDYSAVLATEQAPPPSSAGGMPCSSGPGPSTRTCRCCWTPSNWSADSCRRPVDHRRSVMPDVDLESITRRAEQIGNVDLRPGYVPMDEVAALCGSPDRRVHLHDGQHQRQRAHGLHLRPAGGGHRRRLDARRGRRPRDRPAGRS